MRYQGLSQWVIAHSFGAFMAVNNSYGEAKIFPSYGRRNNPYSLRSGGTADLLCHGVYTW